jgi:hypothetical protein
MRLHSRLTHAFIEIKVDEIETTIFSIEEIDDTIYNLQDVIDDLLKLRERKDENN